MAAKYSVDEVIRQVLDDDSDQQDDEEEMSDEKDIVSEEKEKLDRLIDSYDGGANFNSDLFRLGAKRALFPILCQSLQLSENKEKDCQAAFLQLSSHSINVGSVLLEESRMWLKAIYRRLGGRVGVRRPYYGEITRNIPYDFFLSLRQVFKDLNASEPACYMAGNKKGEVISLTSQTLLESFFCCLSGLSANDVKSFMHRKLTGNRFNHKVKILVSADKDFGFFYKKNTGSMLIQFYYGEWNSHGNPQHFG